MHRTTSEGNPDLQPVKVSLVELFLTGCTSGPIYSRGGRGYRRFWVCLLLMHGHRSKRGRANALSVESRPSRRVVGYARSVGGSGSVGVTSGEAAGRLVSASISPG